LLSEMAEAVADAPFIDISNSDPFRILGFRFKNRADVMKLTLRDIERAYRQEARHVHPDKAPTALPKFVELTAAKNFLLDDAHRFAAIQRYYPAPASAASSGSAAPAAAAPVGKAMPGVVLMQSNLQQALGQRSRATWTRKTDQLVARRTKEQLANVRASPYQLTAQERVDEEAKTAARKRILAAKINASVQRRLSAALARAKASAAAGGMTANVLKRSARGWTRAAYHREGLREQLAAARAAQSAAHLAAASAAAPASSAAPDTTEAREAWRKFRREEKEWTPPPQPTPKRKRPSHEATMRKRARRTERSRKLRQEKAESRPASSRPAEAASSVADASGANVAPATSATGAANVATATSAASVDNTTASVAASVEDATATSAAGVSDATAADAMGEKATDAAAADAAGVPPTAAPDATADSEVVPSGADNTTHPLPDSSDEPDAQVQIAE
jgi:curved DNA-binding protein CbpA